MLWRFYCAIACRNTQSLYIIQKKQDYYNVYYYSEDCMQAVGCKYKEILKQQNKEILKTAKIIDITLILNYDEICIYFRK
jgi:predicted ATP-grasp superfamily ATP-dependent carboligase